MPAVPAGTVRFRVGGVAREWAAAADRLAAAGFLAAGEEAGELVAAAPDAATLQTWLRRRERGEPLAWIVGYVTFCGHRVRVDRGVYVPRRQTEPLARRAAALLPAAGRAADLCTGSGAVAVHLAGAGAAVVGTDVDPRAVACARGNGVVAVRTDLARGLRGGVFDVVTAVAPYVPTDQLRLLPADVVRYEPHHALDGGGDGLDLIRRVVHAAARLLRRGGSLVTEVGGDQDEVLGPVLAGAGFGPPEWLVDADGDLRGVCARCVSRPPEPT